MLKYIALENHPSDARLSICEDGICQTLRQRMGTGGGNVPLVLVINEDDEKQNDICLRCSWKRNGGGVGVWMRKWVRPISITNVPTLSLQEILSNHRQ